MKEIKMPKFDVNDNNVTIIDIFVENGQLIKKNDKILKAESTKMVREITSEEEGYIRLLTKCFDEKSNGDVIAVLYDTREEYENSLSQVITPESAISETNVNATAKAIALAKQLNVDLAKVAAVKNGGIIKTVDVEKFAESQKKNVVGNSVASVPTTINIYDRERVLIIGAGRLSEQVIDILLDDKDKTIVGLVDSYKTDYVSYSYPLFTCDVFEFPDKIDRGLYDTVIIALGGDKKAMLFRKELYELYKSKNIRFTNAIGDNANIRRAVKIGENNIIMHNCFVGTGSQIGDDNIISYGTCIGHNNVIGSHNLFAPAFITPGSVKVGDDNIIMTNVKTINYVTIGNGVVLPVGYNVLSDVPDGTNLLN